MHTEEKNLVLDADTITAHTDTVQNALTSELTDDEKIDIAAAHILKRFKPAFEELAK